MRFNKYQIQQTPQIMIIPMIDIIFFLLVFFMMTTLHMVEQNTLPVTLPASETSQANQSALIAITVTASGTLLFNKEEIDIQSLPSRVREELARQPETAFVLRGDRQAEYGTVIKIFDELRKLGVHNLTIATQAKS